MELYIGSYSIYCDYDFTIKEKDNNTIPNKTKHIISQNYNLKINQNCR